MLQKIVITFETSAEIDKQKLHALGVSAIHKLREETAVYAKGVHVQSSKIDITEVNSKHL